MANRDLKVTLIGEDRTSGAFHSAAKESEGFGSKVKDTGKELSLAFGAAALGGIFGVGEAMVEGAKGAAAYQQVGDKVAQTIKSTGNAAHVTVDGLKSYAEEAEKMSGVDKQLILNGENVMLTFTNVKNAAGEGNDIFTRASESALNLSTTMGIDLVSANKLVGKALNDPIKGLSALSRVGVQFNDQQKKQIEAMVKSHDVMGAQKIILDQLKVKFGGAAEAAGKGLTGSLERSKHAFETMMQHIMSAVMPTIAKLAEFIAGTLIPDIEKMAAWIGRNKGPIEAIAKVIGIVLLPVLAAWGAAAALNAAKSVSAWVAAAFASTAGAEAQEKSALQVGLSWLAMGAKAVVQGARIAAVWVAQIVASAASGAASFVAQVARVVAGWVLMGAQALIQGVKVAAVWTAQIVASAATGAASFIVQVARVVAGWVLMGVQSLIQAARMAAAWFIALGPIGWVTAAVIAIVVLIITHWKQVVAWTTSAWHAVSSAVSTAWHAVIGAIQSAVATVRGWISSAWNWVTSTTSNAWHAITSVVSNAWHAVVSAVGNGISAAINLVRSLPGKIMSALGNLGSLLWNAGKDMIQGLINGAGSLLRNIGSFFLNLLPGWIVGPFKWALGIKSPSKVFAGFGKNIGHGLIQGMSSMQPAVAAQMQALANTQGLAGLGANGTGRVMTPTVALGGMSGSASGYGSVPTVHIEHYNEAKQSPREIAESLTFMARTR